MNFYAGEFSPRDIRLRKGTWKKERTNLVNSRCCATIATTLLELARNSGILSVLPKNQGKCILQMEKRSATILTKFQIKNKCRIVSFWKFRMVRFSSDFICKPSWNPTFPLYPSTNNVTMDYLYCLLSCTWSLFQSNTFYRILCDTIC